MLLYAVWQVQTNRSLAVATVPTLQTITGFSVSDINGYLHDLRTISRSFYFRTIKKAKPAWYRLSSEYLVTQSDTAKILLELFEFPEAFCVDGQIPYGRFVSDTGRKLRIDVEIVEDRLQKAIMQKYLIPIQRDEYYLELGERLICEKEYLHLLAQHFELKFP